MKSLIQFIKEANDENVSDNDIIRIDFLTAKYNVDPDPIYLQLPDQFNESNVQEYMNDAWLEKLPSFYSLAEKFFKLNADNINDVYFEYDSIEHITNENVSKYNIDDKHLIKIDSSKINKNVDDNEIGLFKINNLKYVISFDRFDINKTFYVDGTNNTRIKDVINTIFKATESNSYNQNYPIKIIYNNTLSEIIYNNEKI